MKEFYSSIEKILFASTIAQKINFFEEFYPCFLNNEVLFYHQYPLKIQTQPSYIDFCKIVHPTKISRPKTLHSPQGIAKIIHSIAHIEYSAIDLALDAAYRFQNLPLEYYQDWLEVAFEEIKHFKLLQKILEDLGFCYGDFDVHDNLYQAMIITGSSLIERMGLVHRGLEAMGLDANPFVIAKIQTTSHPIKSKIIQVLQIILNDEISHVHKGNKWWQYTNPSKNSFKVLLNKFASFNALGKILNFQARLKAGFTQEELEELKYFSQQQK
ncbi:DUF455 family protein [Helicobacter sp. 11S03491-1]|uniref:ferritin-like domain-containing protein n=1 Tax=Helicobacter sp. 11S03491-1 TaxID=1476196 RepID=UPI000BA52364|nr:DUF455 family protein [Helicobacter sp. 11S03491-1]PAF41725.1 hypothetical protein BKH45_06460 [Helicobacter sp. 11S03491-1]